LGIRKGRAGQPRRLLPVAEADGGQELDESDENWSFPIDEARDASAPGEPTFTSGKFIGSLLLEVRAYK
jgi:hypothetical protein